MWFKMAMSCILGLMFKMRVLLAFFLLFCAGCTTMQNTKPDYNPVVKESDFQKAFHARTIKLIAPASSTDPSNIERLRSLTHLNIQIPEKIIEKSIIFHANSDEERLLQLKDALYDKSRNTIIWTLRGGYGSARLLDQLNQSPKPKTEKIFIGYSDITALHLFLAQQWGWKTIHGAGLARILEPAQDPQNFEKIAAIISKKVTSLSLAPLIPLNKAALDTQKISGAITGGNLSVIQTGIGTAWQIQTKNKILFLEEVGEKGYRLDRALHHLKQAGLLKDVRAIVFGQFIDSLDAPDAPSSEHITVALERFATNTQIPVFKNNQFGHGTVNYPIVYNAKSKIAVNKTTGEFTWTMDLKEK